MQKILTNSLEHKDTKVYPYLLTPILFAFLFLIAPFYSQPNIGGTGFYLTLNIPIWVTAGWIIAMAIMLAIKNNQVIYPQRWPFLITFPFIIIASTFFEKIALPIDWLFRQLYVLGGMLFLFSLFQFNTSQQFRDKLLYLLVLATGLHGLLSTFQILAPEYLVHWFPYNPGNVPRGMFQQSNVNASFLATGVIITLYLISRPSFKSATFLERSLVSICFGLAVYIVIASGSRIGLLALLISLPLILWGRFNQLRSQKNQLLALLIIGGISVFAGQEGLEKTLDKTALLTEDTYKSARKNMYAIGLELISRKPIQGYGIGGFLKNWNLQASDYVSRHPKAYLPEFTTHPHNELLFWVIEGGFLAIIGIFSAFFGVLLSLFYCGLKRGLSYGAMLLPITLHTQVELPFYISSLHWFLWLFLIYLPLKHQIKAINVKLSLSATRFLQATSLFLAISITVFLVKTDRAQTDLFQYLYVQDKKPPYLQKALNNIYFRSDAEKSVMRSMLYEGVKKNDLEKVGIFERWAKQYVEKKPELEVYQYLIIASKALRPEHQGCGVIKSALEMYAHNETLQKADSRCEGRR